MIQTTIFDLLPVVSRWQDMTDQQIADRIAGSFGKIPTFDSICNIWKFFLGGYEVTVKKSRYTESVYDGREMISVNAMNSTSGFGCACDSIEEAISRIQKGVIDYV